MPLFSPAEEILHEPFIFVKISKIYIKTLDFKGFYYILTKILKYDIVYFIIL